MSVRLFAKSCCCQTVSSFALTCTLLFDSSLKNASLFLFCLFSVYQQILTTAAFFVVVNSDSMAKNCCHTNHSSINSSCASLYCERTIDGSNTAFSHCFVRSNNCDYTSLVTSIELSIQNKNIRN